MNKLVSVIIPFYSGREWLVEAIDSVINQTYHNIEVLLVNDGSKEDISDIIEHYDHRLRYFRKENGGAATARNLGIREAKGDYIAFMDSDDFWLPEKTEKQVHFMEERGLDWSHTGFWYWWPETGKMDLVHNGYNYGFVHEQCKIHFSISTPSVMVSKKMFAEHPGLSFPEEFRTGQDSAFYRIISKYYPLGFLEEPLMKVRMRGGNSGRKAMVRMRMSYQLNEKRKEGVDGFDVKDCFVRAQMKYNAFGYKIISSTNLSDTGKEKIAKLYWLPSFIFERLYSRRYQTNKGKDERFILRFSNNK